MSVTSIDINGSSVTIDGKVFVGFTKRSHEILDQIAELQKDFKELVEEVVEETKLEKKHVGKYFKARFKFETKKPKAEGEIFEILDNIADN